MGGERTLSGVIRPWMIGNWPLFLLSFGDVARVNLVHAVERDDVDGERAMRSLSAAWSSPRLFAASNSCLSASSSECACGTGNRGAIMDVRGCEPGLGVGDCEGGEGDWSSGLTLLNMV